MISQNFKCQCFIELMIKKGQKTNEEQGGEEITEKVVRDRYFKMMEFMNSTGKVEFLDENDVYACKEQVEYSFKIRRRLLATFSQAFDFTNFPVDVQTLTIVVTINASHQGTTPCNFIPLLDKDGKKSASRVDMENFNMGNVWKLDKDMVVNAHDSAKQASWNGKTYPIVKFQAQVHRKPNYFFWNVVAPMNCFVIMSAQSFALPLENMGQRLSISMTMILTATAYKFVVGNMIPDISYNTMLDTYVLWCAFFLFMVVVMNSILCKYGTKLVSFVFLLGDLGISLLPEPR